MATTAKRRRTTASARAPRASALPRRARILDSAERLFAERGFHGVSIRDITGAAGVGEHACARAEFEGGFAGAGEGRDGAREPAGVA
jgi:hypothetical protein